MEGEYLEILGRVQLRFHTDFGVRCPGKVRKLVKEIGCVEGFDKMIGIDLTDLVWQEMKSAR